MTTQIHYIITRDKLILSKENFRDWREIQDQYPQTYIASLGPWGRDELTGYFSDDFGDETAWPFSTRQIDDFLSSDKIIITNQKLC